MAFNKNALIRYKVLDKCLRDRKNKYQLDDLVEKCSLALYEFEGKTETLSRRTIQYDLQFMRSEKLGYNAPIEVYEKKYYRYSDPGFSIYSLPISDKDLKNLRLAIDTLKQFQHLKVFRETPEIISKLEDQIYCASEKRQSLIHFDQNSQLKGLEYFNTIFKAIANKKVLKIHYQAFYKEVARKHYFHPFLLKEYNGRWFMLGKSGKMDKVKIMALDRIKDLKILEGKLFYDEHFDAAAYFKNTIGVTVLPDSHLIHLTLAVSKNLSPYVLSKPLHPSMQLNEKLSDGSCVISIEVHWNYELEQLILGFADDIKVLDPNSFRERIMQKLKRAHEQYENSI